jgi:hypothetical protein
MLGASRIIVVFFCVLWIIVGVALAAAYPGQGGILMGFILVVIGIGGIVAIALERMRYRSEASEPVTQPPSRAGGDPPGTALPRGFQRSDERFLDPSTGVLMRVWFDPATGERRYVPEPDTGGGSAPS